MLRLTEIRLNLDHTEQDLRRAVTQRLNILDSDIVSLALFKRGYDARKTRAIEFVYTVDIELKNESLILAELGADPHVKPTPDMQYHPVAVHLDGVHKAACQLRPIVIGFGPCGIFAALILAQLGLCPIVLERGKAVRDRTKDTWDLWRKRTLHAESNVQFGEGGAGTFSDGKLWSQISDPRHLTRKVLQEFVKAGAPEDILYLSKPHIGTFKLVAIVERMRAEIIRLGGEVRFEQRVTDLLIHDGKVRGLTLASGEELIAHHIILAIGHSARDTFEMLYRRGVYLEAKPFSIGFRIEHPQGLIDRARFGPYAGHPLLGAADYKLVHHASNGRSVYSFCMCPGGTVVAATSEIGCVVTNGMSQYSRAERNANAGIVVGIAPQEYRQDHKQCGPVNPLDGLAYQRFWERRAFDLGGSNYCAPGQRVGDFLEKKPSRHWGDVRPSYTPEVVPVNLFDSLLPSLPPPVLQAITEALPAFERRIAGFAMPDAVLTGVETRTSSPLRIVRGKDYQSLQVQGLYPAGEGAGYAGGIMSAAVDGIEAAEALALATLEPRV